MEPRRVPDRGVSCGVLGRAASSSVPLAEATDVPRSCGGLLPAQLSDVSLQSWHGGFDAEAAFFTA